jgi:hypothetical protein
MTPERMAELVERWTRFYTRELPTPIAQRRVAEIGADVHDHIAHERARGASDRRIALSILSRMVRGLAADASWRRQHAKPTTARRSTIAIVLAAALVLLLPLVAMQITDEVAWSPADFAAAGVLLVGSGLIYALVARKAGNIAYRAAVGVAVATALLLLWVVGAVGVIGEDGDRADLLYGGVLAVGVIGAVSARLKPQGMARALLAMALATALVAVIALIAGKHEAPLSSASEILGLNGFFVALFLASAWLFRHAARRNQA